MNKLPNKKPAFVKVLRAESCMNAPIAVFYRAGFLKYDVVISTFAIKRGKVVRDYEYATLTGTRKAVEKKVLGLI